MVGECCGGQVRWKNISCGERNASCGETSGEEEVVDIVVDFHNFAVDLDR